MGKLSKPSKPKIKKPKVPSKPREPQRYIGRVPVTIGNPGYYGGGNRNAVWKTVSNNKSSVCLEGKGFRLQVPVNFRKTSSIIYLSVEDPNYKKKKDVFQEKMVIYHEKMKKIKPQLDEYEAAIADYEYRLALYEMQKKEEAL